jgi:Predicted transcriptional regulators
MLAQRLKQIRSERKITQDEVAQFLGVKRQTYSAYERSVSVPDSLTLKKLADYYEVSTEEFFAPPDTQSRQEQRMLLLARKAQRIPEEQRDRLIRNFEENLELYLEAMELRHKSSE